MPDPVQFPGSGATIALGACTEDLVPFDVGPRPLDAGGSIGSGSSEANSTGSGAAGSGSGSTGSGSTGSGSTGSGSTGARAAMPTGGSGSTSAATPVPDGAGSGSIRPTGPSAVPPFPPKPATPAKPATAANPTPSLGLSDGAGIAGLIGDTLVGAGAGPKPAVVVPDGHRQGFAGTGFGVGGRMNRFDSVTLSIDIAVQGPLDAASTRRVFDRIKNRIQFCYERLLLANPSLPSGTLVAEAAIGSSGEVITATAKGISPALEVCAQPVVRALVFAKPTADKPVTVTAKFTITHEDPRPPGDKPVAATTAPDRASIYRPRASGALPTDLAPGTTSLLAPYRDAIAACFTGDRFFAGTIDLGGPAPVVDGLDEAHAACVVAALGAQGPSKDGKQRRCAFSAGKPTLPVIEVTDASTSDAIALAAKSRTDHLPFALHAPIATQWKQIGLATSAIFSTGHDVVFAIERDHVWTLVRPPPSLVPVARNTGGMWHPIRMPGPGPRLAPTIRIVVRKADITLDGTPATLDTLSDLLGKRKAGAFNARTDLEIAAEPDAIYGDVIRASDIASEIGFTDWGFVD